MYGSASVSTLATLAAAARSRDMSRSCLGGGGRPLLKTNWQRRINCAQLLAKNRLDARQRVFVVGLEAQRQCRRRVRGAHQSPAVREVDANTVERSELAVAEIGLQCQLFHQREFALLGAVDFQLGGRDRWRQRIEMVVEAGIGGAENFDQSRGGVHAVVETEPALVEEDMAAELAAEQRTGFGHFF